MAGATTKVISTFGGNRVPFGMRLQGRITRWDDARGFGFIAWHGDESEVFVHIKAFSRPPRRPVVGDIVTYEIAKGKNGKSRAEKVRFASRRKPRKQTPGKYQSGWVPVIFSCLFVALLFLSVYFGRIPWLIVAAYFALSVVTFFAYAWDKSSARMGLWRTPESTLHLLSLAGGWPGALAAQRLLRHKSVKQEFLSGFWFTVFMNVLAVGYLVWTGDEGFINQLIASAWQREM
jgi:uncharacterized membrane protein YsdA (DUF1294 family)/cold shock CspA family protein